MGKTRVVVVDDGCGPDYAAVFSRLAAMPQVNVLRNAVNLGKGAALKYGINYILTEGSKAIGIVTADADGQHAELDIKRIGEMPPGTSVNLTIIRNGQEKRVAVALGEFPKQQSRRSEKGPGSVGPTPEPSESSKSL